MVDRPLAFSSRVLSSPRKHCGFTRPYHSRYLHTVRCGVFISWRRRAPNGLAGRQVGRRAATSTYIVRALFARIIRSVPLPRTALRSGPLVAPIGPSVRCCCRAIARACESHPGLTECVTTVISADGVVGASEHSWFC